MAKIIKTLDDIINREDRYDPKKIMFYAQTEDGELIIQDKTLLDIYMPFVRPYIQTMRVERKERDYYRFKPQLLSLDIYGTPSLAWLLMIINDRECPSKFYIKQTINLVPSSVIANVYNIVASKSKTQIKENWKEYLGKVGEYIEW